MAEGTISIGSTTLDTPIGYTHEPIKAETYDRAIRGNLIINRAVTVEDQPISKYRFEISDIVNSKMLAIKAEAVHISNLYLIDYLQIVEVLSGDGTTTTFYSQRELSGATPLPVITLGGTSKTVTVTEDINPAAGNVYVKANVSGRARFIFGDVPPDTDDNIIIQYEPKYAVRIISFRYVGRIKDVGNYTLICEEV
jgi:hypothetical protein